MAQPACVNKNHPLGYAIFYSVIILSAIAVVTILTLANLSIKSIRSSGDLVSSHQARSITDACLEEALQQIRDSNSFSGSGSLNLGAEICYYNVLDFGGNIRQIAASSTVRGAVRKAIAETSQLNPQIQLSSWQEVADF